MMKEQKKMNNKGFSLVELIIVIAIMAILVGVLAPQFIKYVEKSRQSTDMQNIQQYKTAIEAYVASTPAPEAVKISVGSGNITIDKAAALDGTGLTTTTALKSSNWNACDWTYNVTGTNAYKWVAGGSNSPAAKDGSGNNLNTIFNIAE